ncbi:uncharacterized protein LOC125056783 [Pieris napi]|uniref:uncharacterized protein LOC125056783 n=1 Tax=Pieris napi TaxID=78633 RepID=UPI001FBB00C7|nr:uncharacterized protein LOC125056783 [Pieris napi]
MARNRLRNEKDKKRGFKGIASDDFAYWDPYYIDSEPVQRFKKDVEVYDALDEGLTTESTSTAQGVDPEIGPAIALTCVFGAAFIILPFFVRKGPNRGLTQCSIMLTIFCMWIFWVTVYIGQMNPLMGPRLENTSVAWIAHKLGNQVERSSNGSS